MLQRGMKWLREVLRGGPQKPSRYPVVSSATLDSPGDEPLTLDFDPPIPLSHAIVKLHDEKFRR